MSFILQFCPVGHFDKFKKGIECLWVLRRHSNVKLYVVSIAVVFDAMSPDEAACGNQNKCGI